MYITSNYLFAAYLQTEDGGSYSINDIEKIRPGRAKFYFKITPEEAERVQLKFHESCCMKFEQMRKNTIDLAY